jgi:hypothetical protein
MGRTRDSIPPLMWLYLGDRNAMSLRQNERVEIGAPKKSVAAVGALSLLATSYFQGRLRRERVLDEFALILIGRTPESKSTYRIIK